MRFGILTLFGLLLLASTGCNCINLADCSSSGGYMPASRGGLAGRINGDGPLLGDGHRIARMQQNGHHMSRNYDGPQGPSSAQVGYPYYTNRGPRDFLTSNPPSIGY